MSDVMWKGELKGNIATDSLEGAKAYGIGPVSFLKGEIVLLSRPLDGSFEDAEVNLKLPKLAEVSVFRLFQT